MKNFLYYLAALVLMWTMSLPVKAMMPDDLLKGKEIVAGVCKYNEYAVRCVEIELDGIRYVAMLNGNYEPIVVFQVKKGATYPYGEEVLTLVWGKGDV